MLPSYFLSYNTDVKNYNVYRIARGIAILDALGSICFVTQSLVNNLELSRWKLGHLELDSKMNFECSYFSFVYKVDVCRLLAMCCRCTQPKCG